MCIKKTYLKFSLYVSVILVGACGVDYVSNQDVKSFISKNEKNVEAKVIYGEDNRQDLYEVKSSRIKKFEASVVGLTKKNRVIKKRNGNYTILVNSFGKERFLCKSERFYHQKMTTHCSGVLVGSDTVITAGHCIEDMEDCNNTTFVFGLSKYKKDTEINYADFPAENVYQCKDVIHSVFEISGLDFAVIKLNKKVKNRTGLRYRTFGKPKKGDEVLMIGKPSGIPTKVNEDARISYLRSSYMRTTLDAYGASSGSPVINAKTGDVEGILVGGATDFIYDKNEDCFRSHICDYVKRGTQCPGEKATLVSKILPYLPANSGLIEKNEVLAIPDSPANGVSSVLSVNKKQEFTNFFVHLDIEHTWSGDLTVDLTSPSGKTLTLINSNGTAGSNLKITLGDSPEFQEELRALASDGTVGNWKLKVSDGFSRDIGVLKRWALEFK